MSEKKRVDALEKISSGIEGFDDITVGGLPLRRTTLLMGGPGRGKTVFALRMLVRGAVRHHTPGIFVAFEEDAHRVSANAETFGWDMRGLEKRPQLFFVDACMRSDVVKSGAFDLTGLLAALEAKAREMGETDRLRCDRRAVERARRSTGRSAASFTGFMNGSCATN